MLFVEILNSRSNSLQLGGYDTIQVAKKMTKNSRDNSHCKQSSQQSSQDPSKDQSNLTRRRIGHRPEHQMFFLLVFLKEKNIFLNKKTHFGGPNRKIGQSRFRKHKKECT